MIYRRVLFAAFAFICFLGGQFLFGVDASCVSCHTSERKMQNLFTPPEIAGGEQGEG
ncbi:MAG: hypothetical protein SNJ78_09730 [Spirochaetales bacterium]